MVHFEEKKEVFENLFSFWKLQNAFFFVVVSKKMTTMGSNLVLARNIG